MVVVMVPIRTSHCHCVDNASVVNQQWQDRTLDKRLFGNFRLWVFTHENFCQEHLLVSKGIMSLYLLLFCKLLMVTTRSCRTGACLCLVIPVFFFKSWKLPSLGEYREKNYLYRNEIHGKLLPGRRNDQFSFDLK